MNQHRQRGLFFSAILTVLVLLNCKTVSNSEEAVVDEGLPAGDGTTWYYRAFGQSVDLIFRNTSHVPAQDGINNVWLNPAWAAAADADNFIQSETQMAEALKPDAPVILKPEDKVLIDSRGGKLANQHDGISYFFTVLPTDKLFTLTAEVTKIQHGPNPDTKVTGKNGQGGGGLMVRDVLGYNRKVPSVTGYEELPAISNIVGVGFRGNNNNVGSLFRDGCVSITNAIGVPTIAFANTAGGNTTGTKLTYILERKNDGFYFTVKNGETTVTEETKITGNTDLVQRVDKEKMYWGFFAGREVRILVENIALADNGPADITPTKPPFSAGTFPDPDVALRSRNSVSAADYVLKVRPNYAGNLKVSRGAASLYDGAVSKGGDVDIAAVLGAGTNSFDYVFTPADSTAPSGNPVSGAFTVTLTNTPALPVVYAAPSAAGGGTGVDAANAIALTDAVSGAQPGQTIYLINGDYGETNIRFTIDNSGIKGKYITLQPAPGVSSRLRLRTIVLNGTYVWVKDLTIGGPDADHRISTPNANPDNPPANLAPVTVGGDYNVLERCTAQHGTNSGFNMGGSSSVFNPNLWPKYNKYLNCTSFGNKDQAMADADGFAAKDVGPGNEYTGCVAYDNADDGWDLFNRVGNGPSLPVLMENCIAYNNPANGFKVGGETQPVGHIIRNCLSYDNGMAGYSDNFNPGPLDFSNCVSIDNGTQNFIFRDNTLIKPANTLKDSFSYRTAVNKNKGLCDAISGTVTNTYLTDTDGVSKLGRKTLSDNDFVSLNRNDAYTRTADGTLVRGNFGKLK